MSGQSPAEPEERHKMRAFALIAATMYALTFATPSQGVERAWGAQIPDWGRQWTELRARVAAADASTLTDPLLSGVRVVELPVNLAAARVPGMLAAAASALEPAMKSVRSTLARDPDVLQALVARGYNVDDVIGVERSGAAVTVFTGLKS
jgi:hypothetical protein